MSICERKMVERWRSGKPSRQRSSRFSDRIYPSGDAAALLVSFQSLVRKTPPRPATRKPAMSMMRPCKFLSASLEPNCLSWYSTVSVSWLPGIQKSSVLPAISRRASSRGWSGVLSPNRMVALGRCSSTASMMWANLPWGSPQISSCILLFWLRTVRLVFSAHRGRMLGFSAQPTKPNQVTAPSPACGRGERNQLPATVILSIKIDPVSLVPRIKVSAPIATICMKISFMLPAIVISSTGYWISPFSTQ